MQTSLKPGPGPAADSWGRTVGIVAVFALAGPFLGAVGVNAAVTAVGLAGALGAADAGELGRIVIGGMVVGTIVALLIAYAFGILPALAVGAVVALADRRGRGISPRIALGAAIAVGAIVSALAWITVPVEGRAQWISALVAAHLLAALGCSLIARRLFEPAPHAR